MKKFIFLMSFIFLLFIFSGCNSVSDAEFHFTSDNIELSVGEQIALPLEVSETTLEDLDFDFSILGIAQVTSGTLQALDYGETTLTVSLKNDPSITKSIGIKIPLILTSPKEVVEVNTTVRLTIQDFANRAEFDWVIGDTNIASIDANYNIKGLKPGTTIITVTNKLDPTISGVWEIVIPLELSMPTTKIPVGKPVAVTIANLDLTDTTDPLDFTWTAADNTILSIDNNCYVTGLAAGTTTLTASYRFGTGIQGSIEITVGGTVENGIATLYLESPSNAEFMVQAGEFAYAKIDGITDNSLFSWYSLTPAILSVSENGRVTALLAGTGTLVARLKSNSEVFSTITITVYGEPNVDYVSRLLAIADDELGYPEGADGYSKYGAWYSPAPEFTFGHWCAMFVSWCAYQSGISTDIIPKYASVSLGQDWFIARSLFQYKESYTPKAGDIIFFTSDGASHTGIVVSSDATRVYTIEGNTSNTVAYRNYTLQYSTITGYGTPEYPAFTGESGGVDFDPNDSSDGSGETTN